MKTNDPENIFAQLEYLRKEREYMLKPDERWLTADDIIQAEDAYFADGVDWWRYDGPHAGGPSEIGKFVHLQTLCYTPKGKKLRLFKSRENISEPRRTPFVPAPECGYEYKGR